MHWHSRQSTKVTYSQFGLPLSVKQDVLYVVMTAMIKTEGLQEHKTMRSWIYGLNLCEL